MDVRKETVFEMIKRAAEVQSPKNEILAVAGCTIEQADEICKEFAGKLFDDVIADGKLRGMQSLRVKQFKKAVQDEDSLMQIWLGKNILGQADKAEVKQDHTVTTKAKIMFGDTEITFDS